MSDAMVTVAEVAAAMGRRPAAVEAEARELSLAVRPDWAGRPALAVDEARALASGAARRDYEHTQGWEAHLRDCKAWRQGRDQSARQAARKVRATARGGSDGAISGEAQRAAREAAEHYERTVARPRFNGSTAVPLEYVEEVSA